MPLIKPLAVLGAVALVVGVAPTTAQATTMFAFDNPSATVSLTADNTNHLLTIKFNWDTAYALKEFDFNTGSSTAQLTNFVSATGYSSIPGNWSITANSPGGNAGKFGWNLFFGGTDLNNSPATLVVAYTGTLDESQIASALSDKGNNAALHWVPKSDPTNTFWTVAAPEPSTACLALSGLAPLAFAGVWRRRRHGGDSTAVG